LKKSVGLACFAAQVTSITVLLDSERDNFQLFVWINPFEVLTTESINGLAVEVGFRLVLFVVMIESLALIILLVESNEVVCRLEFECLRIALDGMLLAGSFSTLRKRSGMSMVFDFDEEFRTSGRCIVSSPIESPWLLSCPLVSSSTDVSTLLFISIVTRLPLLERSDGVASNL
jgi:hypothetical protein